MRGFTYRAVDSNNLRKSGVLEAENQDSASQILLARGLYPLSINETGSFREVLSRDLKRGKLSDVSSIQIINDLGHLIGSGIEIAVALALVEETSDARTKPVIHQILERVRRGYSLSAAMEESSGEFPPYVVATVRACETSNSLSVGLLKLGSSQRTFATLRSQIVTALIYPGFIAIAVGTAIFVLIAIVVPTIEDLFSSQLDRLPWQMLFLLSISNFVRDFWVPIFFTAVVAATSLIGLARTIKFRIHIENLMMAVPLLGEFIRAVEATHLTSLLSLLVGSGVSLLDAVSLARDSVRLRTSQNALNQTLLHLREGREFHRALTHVASLSLRALGMIRIGEATGRLPQLLEEVAQDAERQVSVIATRFLALLTPVMTLLFGVIAGFVLYAVATAILSVNALATNGG